ncbi:unnamed protein product, partial [Didymodactylos carnosus]
MGGNNPKNPVFTSIQEHLDDMVNKIENIEHRQRFKDFLQDYSHLFDTFKITVAKTEVSHVINTKPHSPPFSKCYTMSKQKEDALYDILMELMNVGLISKAKSPYAAPALLTPKSDGSWRFVKNERIMKKSYIFILC